MDGSPVTLDQLAAFVAVADHSSFSGAARALHKVQSAVSYNIKALEEHLGVQLFERSTRHVALTDEGRVLLEEARAITAAATQLSTIASEFGRGVEALVRVAIDIVYPSRLFAQVAAEFRRKFVGVHLDISAATLGSVFRDLSGGLIELGLTGMPDLPAGIVGTYAGASPMIAVVAPGHPLAEQCGAIPPSELERHLQLVVADPTEASRDREFHVLSPRTWRLTDMAMRRELLLAGVGWGRMPISWVEHDLQHKRLVPITPAAWAARVPSIAMQVVHRVDAPLGPAATWLAKELCRAGKQWEDEVGRRS